MQGGGVRMFRFLLPTVALLGSHLFFRLRDQACVYSGLIGFRNTKLGKGVVVGHGTVVANSTIKEFTFINRNAGIFSAEIGPYCSIGPNVLIGENEHLTEKITTCQALYPERIQTSSMERNAQRTYIEPDVWVGGGSVILKGIRVGVGSVIGAGAVVTKDVSPFSIVGGVPAKVIRYRFTEEGRRMLLQSNWWNHPVVRIRLALIAASNLEEEKAISAFCEFLR